MFHGIPVTEENPSGESKSVKRFFNDLEFNDLFIHLM